VRLPKLTKKKSMSSRPGRCSRGRGNKAKGERIHGHIEEVSTRLKRDELIISEKKGGVPRTTEGKSGSPRKSKGGWKQKIFRGEKHNRNNEDRALQIQ